MKSDPNTKKNESQPPESTPIFELEKDPESMDDRMDVIILDDDGEID